MRIKRMHLTARGLRRACGSVRRLGPSLRASSGGFAAGRRAVYVEFTAGGSSAAIR